ncbi:MAG: tetratricopeptide repeat protein [Bacteroidota bacterium]
MNQVINIIFLFLYALLHSCLYAQNYDKQFEDLYNQSVEYYNSGNKEKAVEIYSNIINADDKQSDAYWSRAIIYGELEKFEEAIADMEVVIRLTPAFPFSYGNIGWLKILQEKYMEAREYINKANELYPEYPGWNFNTGHTYLLTGDQKTARDYYSKALQLLTSEKEFNEGFITDMELFIKKGWKAEACREELDWVRDEFNNVYSYYIRSVEYFTQAWELKEKGNCNKAIDLFLKSVKEENNSSRPRLDEISYMYTLIGYCYCYMTIFDKAEEYYLKALELSQKSNNRSDEEKIYYSLAIVNNDLHKFGKAVMYYDKAIDMAEKSGNKEDRALYLSKKAVSYQYWYKYEEAIEYYKQSLQVSAEIKQEIEVAGRLNNIGLVYHEWGKYDKALNYYEKSLETNNRIGNEKGIIDNYNNIGALYDAWRKYDKALNYYEQALKIAVKPGYEAKAPNIYNNTGMIYLQIGKYDDALKYFEKAQQVAEELKLEDELASYYYNIGDLYKTLNKFEEALVYFELAIGMDKKYGKEKSIAFDMYSLGTVLIETGEFEEGLKQILKSIEVIDKIGNLDDKATILNNIAACLAGSGHYEYAIKYYTEAINIKEEIRKKAPLEAKRDYLASQIHTYDDLISTYIKYQKIGSAFQAIEMSRSKVMAEQISQLENIVLIPAIDYIRDNLRDDVAVIIYATIDNLHLTRIAITKENIIALEGKKKEFIDNVFSQLGEKITTRLSFKLNEAELERFNRNDKPEIITEQDIDLENKIFSFIIDYYRRMILSPSSSEIRKADKLGNLLYVFLIKPLYASVKDKKEIIIVPDGVLGYLPFETLVDDNGKYFVENHDISYAQSLSVLDIIKKRDYSSNRKPVLAFGGAVYNADTYEADMRLADDLISSEMLAYNKEERGAGHLSRGELVQIRRSVDIAMAGDKKSLRSEYESLGYGKWSNLSGTLAEVRAMASIIPGIDTITGNQVKEDNIKELSEKGKLSEYKVLHFSTHGTTIPEIPELSALILSQFDDLPGKDSEDGYLRMGEIAKLDIKADFVNLSACETGLGKIYSGEGVVGLSQAFIIAGANGISVSLWSVSDRSTAQFMTDVYNLVQKQNYSYSGAINQVKRNFINGAYEPVWKAPFYWAPFVYYGK